MSYGQLPDLTPMERPTLAGWTLQDLAALASIALAAIWIYKLLTEGEVD